MKTTQSSGTRPDHQTVAGTVEFKSHGKAIALSFTDQQLSPPAGSALFWGWLRLLDWLPSQREGYMLDLDSPQRLHKDREQEGVASGYTKQGIKPCLHPLLAVLAEVPLVAQLWLRPGNPTCGNNVTAFFLDLREKISSPIPNCNAVESHPAFTSQSA